jgi:hypothetical protein
MYQITPQHNFDYIEATDPTIIVDPPCQHVSWLNKTTGQIFFCTSNTPGANVWVGQMGDTIEPA